MTTSETREATPVEQHQPGGSGPSPQRWAGRLAEVGVRRYSGLIVLAGLIVAFGLWSDLFLTKTTLITILSAQSLTAILAIAVVFPLAAGVFDLSAAQNMGATALVVAYLMVNVKMGVVPAILCGLGFGAAVGVLNGVLVAFVGFDSFIRPSASARSCSGSRCSCRRGPTSVPSRSPSRA